MRKSFRRNIQHICLTALLLTAIQTWFVSVESRPQDFNSGRKIDPISRPETTPITPIAGNATRERVRILTKSTYEGSESQEIVFPEDIEEVELKPMLRLDERPSCANDKTFCEDIESYPHNYVQGILRTTKNHNDLFGIDEEPSEIVNRIGEPEENYFCSVVDTVIYPKIGETKNKKWKYIINQGVQERYQQGIRVELCSAPNRPCNMLENFFDNYVTKCKQKYVYRTLLSINGDGVPATDKFLMPSACCCSYRIINDFLARSGVVPTTSPRNQTPKTGR